ncbi:response regulator transcription factor [Maribacter sp. CXY002]|uniref:response regulator transcription factor n=1 Tax=Maribacter luteocoastalis TaxID=3407671 RepID=UPI003B66DF14
MATIFLIEDDSTIRENTTEFLEMEGYKVKTATNGKEGLEKMSVYKPDLIVCDIRMPEMDGLELLEKLGLHTELKTVPLIFFSAKSEKKDISIGLKQGAFDYIVKPSDLDDLLASIKRCLLQRKQL